MADHHAVRVQTQILVRRPVKEVFEAFVNPEVTRNFWFTKGSGKLEEGKSIVWEWEMYGVSTQVYVKQVTPLKKISIEWDEPPTTVDFEFDAIGADRTYVVIRNYGFQQTGQELIVALMDNTGGFTTVLDGLKAYLEHGIHLNLIADKFPQKDSE